MFNRWIANPREHYASDDGFFPQPICGQPLSLERANFADQPTGLARLCPRCVSKLAAMHLLIKREAS
jgi:hypothetical protein